MVRPHALPGDVKVLKPMEQNEIISKLLFLELFKCLFKMEEFTGHNSDPD